MYNEKYFARRVLLNKEGVLIVKKIEKDHSINARTTTSPNIYR